MVKVWVKLLGVALARAALMIVLMVGMLVTWAYFLRPALSQWAPGVDMPQRTIGPSAEPCKDISGFDPSNRERYMPRTYQAGDKAKPVKCIEWVDKHQGHCQVTTECGES